MPGIDPGARRGIIPQGGGRGIRGIDPSRARRVTRADAHARLVAALARQLSGESDTGSVEILETHISTVLLTGRHAYKLKKPVDLGFLDFTTLAARRHFCEQELRLNRRLAPSLYLSVVPITGTLDAPVMGGTGEAIDYAVQMREFPQDALLSRVLARGLLAPADIDALAGEVARFHARIDVAPAASPFGSPETIAGYARQNFKTCDGSAAAPRRALASLSRWTESELAAARGDVAPAQGRMDSSANATATCTSATWPRSMGASSSSTASNSTTSSAGST